MPRQGILFSMGNPLLDITAEVDKVFLDKYGLEPNNAILADDKHKTMYQDMVNQFKVEYVAGGAAQNTIRVAQWMIGIPNATTFMGCIAKDKFGDILEKKAIEGGVNARYMYHDTEPTGTCAVLVSDSGKNRSLCAYLAAANCFSKEHFNIPGNRALLEKAEYYYIAGYPLTVCPDAMLEVAQLAHKKSHMFSMNLSAPFLCQFFKEPMMKILPYVGLLFCNETEALTFSKEHDFETEDLKEICRKIAAMPKQDGSQARIVVITQGADPTFIYKDGEVKEYPVIHLDEKEIVDTNGAGDAFVGGFLAELVQGRSIDECIRGANYAANYIIQRPGCSLPHVQLTKEHNVAF